MTSNVEFLCIALFNFLTWSRSRIIILAQAYYYYYVLPSTGPGFQTLFMTNRDLSVFNSDFSRLKLAVFLCWSEGSAV
jgi:hypothetical protein